MSGAAIYLEQMPGWQGDARLYRLDPPLTHTSYDYQSGEDIEKSIEHVIVSAANVMFSGPETYIFPANPPGSTDQPADWSELDGSERGILDHDTVLSNIGYEIVSVLEGDVEQKAIES